MSSHDGFLALAAAAIDFELDPDERAVLDRHLAGCEACRRTAAMYRDDAAVIASEPVPSLAPGRSSVILANALRPQRSSPPLRLLAVAALLAIVGGGIAVVGSQYLGRDRDTDQAVLPSPGPSSTTSPAEVGPSASPSSRPSVAPLPSNILVGGSGPLVRGPAREVGQKIRMAPASDGNLYVSIPNAGGSILAMFDRSGKLRTGWPATLPDTEWCEHVLPADGGSVRLLCTMADGAAGGPGSVRAFAFDASGAPLAGWPVDLGAYDAESYIAARVVGDALTLFAWRSLGADIPAGQPAGEGWVMTIGGDGSVTAGTRVGYTDDCCRPGTWAIGPDKVAYGVVVHVAEGGTAATSELVAVADAGVPAGFPVAIEGVASTPSFDANGRLHLTVASVSVDSPYHGPARTHVFDTAGRAVAGGSADLGFVATDTCVGLEGSCEGPAAPLVGAEGTTFVIGSEFQSTTAARLGPSGEMVTGWPYRSGDGSQPIGVCPPTEVCEGGFLATPAISPDNVLFLVHGPPTASAGGKLVAVGPDGRVVAGWPVGLRRSGSEFWSVVVGSDGIVYGLAVEPEPNDSSSATILGIAPDSTVRYTTTIIDP